MKRLLKKPPPKLRLPKRLPKKVLTPLLPAPKPLPLAPKLLPPVPKLLLRPTLLRPPLLRPTPLLLLRLKKRSKSQPFGALTETRNGRSSFGKAAFFFARCFFTSVSLGARTAQLTTPSMLSVKLVGVPVDPAMLPCGRRQT